MVEQNVVWGALSLQLSLLSRADRPLLHELVAELEPLVLNLLHLLARKPIILLELQAWQSILKQRVRILEAIADLHVKVILQRLKLGLLLGIHRQSSSGSSLCLVNTLKRRSLIRKLYQNPKSTYSYPYFKLTMDNGSFGVIGNGCKSGSVMMLMKSSSS